MRVVLEAPRFQLHTTLDVVGATSGSPPAGKLEIRLQLSTDPAPRAPGEVAYGGEALKLGVRLRDLRLHTDAEERALKGAARVAGGELPLLSVSTRRCCLLCIYMPAIDRSLSDCRWSSRHSTRGSSRE